MDNTKTQIIEQIKQGTNILISVSSNPSVDQLSAAIGLTLVLNHLGKHATSVFSGELPPVINFLHPEKTIEKDTDSLRDFIIALDKSKADKLRYKVEDDQVKIFITPYRSSINEKDLIYSQGDLNVDVVVAIGVQTQNDLDTAITTHGRILHDATVVSFNNIPGGELGSINWVDETASSLSEMAAQLAAGLTDEKLDASMATALLTGIVAETERFSNEKTSADTMTVSAVLMAAGANQQLVASELEPPAVPDEVFEVPNEAPADAWAQPPVDELPQIVETPPEPVVPEQPPLPEEPPVEEDGALHIDHSDFETELAAEFEEPEETEVEEPRLAQIHIDEHGTMHEPIDGIQAPPVVFEPSSQGAVNNSFIIGEPTLGGTLTANTKPEAYEMPVDTLSAQANDSQILSHDSTHETSAQAFTPQGAIPNVAFPSQPDQPQEAANREEPAHFVERTLAELEEDIRKTTREEAAQPPPVTNARDAVNDAMASDDNSPFDPSLITEPVASSDDITDQINQAVENGTVPLAEPAGAPSAHDQTSATETQFVPPAPSLPPPANSQPDDNTYTPPSVPPPMMPPAY